MLARMEKADSTCPIHPITGLAAADVNQLFRLQARLCYRLKKGITSEDWLECLRAAAELTSQLLNS